MVITSVPQQRSVLSGILALSLRDHIAAGSRLNFLTANTKIEHFQDSYEFIYKTILVYWRTVRSVISYEHFVDLAKRKNLEITKLTEIITIFVELRDAQVLPENEFRYQVLRLREVTKVDRVTDALVETMDVLHYGKKVGTKHLNGADSAILHLQKLLTEVGRDDGSRLQSLSNRDMSRVLVNYADRKFGRVNSYPTGFAEVDDVTSGGFQPGDLVFLAGYTSEGKSTLLLSMFDYWVFTRRLNVVIASAEHPPEIVMRRMASIRSADPKYGGVVPYKKLKEGRLTPDEEKQLERVIYDMANNPEYGKFTIFPVAHGSTVTTIFEEVEMVDEVYPVDIFGWDYIGYASSEVKRNTDREEIGHVIRSSKIRATTFRGGKGLCVVSPFQVSRGKWEKALTVGKYTLACMEESSAAEKAADIVMSVLNLGEAGGNKSVGQVLKVRDGDKFLTPFELGYDSITSRIVPKSKSISL